jgi:hypothetical protein
MAKTRRPDQLSQSPGALSTVPPGTALLAASLLLLAQSLMWAGSPSPLNHRLTIGLAFALLLPAYFMLYVTYASGMCAWGVLMACGGIVVSMVSLAAGTANWLLLGMVLLAVGTALVGIGLLLPRPLAPDGERLRLLAGWTLLSGSVISLPALIIHVEWVALAITWLIAAFFVMPSKTRAELEKQLSYPDKPHPLTAIVRLGELLGFLSLASVLIGVAVFVLQLSDRQQNTYFTAWQTIVGAQGKPGNGGRVQALTYLATRHVQLEGIDASCPEDAPINPDKNVYCPRPCADLSLVDLHGAYLRSANFQCADLFGANLRGADLELADFDGVYLRCADLRDVRHLTADRLAKAQIWQSTRLSFSLPRTPRAEQSDAEDPHACERLDKGRSWTSRLLQLDR